MKELSIEEKAKAYDEAIDKVAHFIKKHIGFGCMIHPNSSEAKELFNIFPELAETNDERIRKWLIGYFQRNEVAENIKTYDIIAWLEKQGTLAKLSEEEQNRFAKGVLTSCALSFIDYLDAHKYEGKMCVSNGECEDIENAFHNTMWDRLHRYYCKYIEKQGEQKHAEWSEEDERIIEQTWKV